MSELAKSLKDKFKDFDITPQHLGKVIRDNNKTHKRKSKKVQVKLTNSILL